ncbi:3-polyprenyl-4-hydroxybenzoate carboxylyase [Candidatus Photodesmus katoptron]|uniref:Flavin prenyltransferase UbiX n=1 Tax=Candidatus Photodesmus katoptron Akat1 TaxID=1236703 RepID=S3DJB9_9GAMM|nr:flavin prenyltransferase UbiX [Candidatus Photodesmus katoptron]EPE37239.1 putative aromatic acid decarboxylase [Candidatus Photodesmus katoptron Akat1]KEY90105.1 3-polyprenyl-4-hydroxybenzoate carboxylyase [Candidatus Photodesmus katoptron]
MFNETKSITLAFTGASGACYGLRLLRYLLLANYKVYLLISSAARVVLESEHNLKLSNKTQITKQAFSKYLNCSLENLEIFGKNDWFSVVASGSGAPKKMVICPCSVGSVAAIAYGMSENLIERAADVIIKEQGQLLLVVRETPFSTLHLKNMHKLSKMGITIMPASPGFYHQPQSIEDLIDFIVARILDHFGIQQRLLTCWGE